MPDPIRLGILYSEPLAYEEQGEMKPLTRLDFKTERNWLFDSFEESGRAVQVRVESALPKNLSTLVLQGYSALHYSGHGHPLFLAFENGRGGLHEMTVDHLKTLVGAGGPSGLKFLFVSACHSMLTGQAFVDAGIPHVVAVRLDSPVYDSAARTFARDFYLALFAGRTVQQAFEVGKAAVKTEPGLPDPDEESDKFRLLPEYGYHDEVLFGDAPAGGITDLTPPAPPDLLPTPPEHFLGREIELCSVVSTVSGNRLTTITGAPGIGKTALALAAGHYLHERRMFKDGVFFVSLRDAASAEAARAGIALVLGLPAAKDEDMFAALARQNLLLVLDNCEDPLNRDRTAFRNFFAALLRSGSDVKLLLTSRESLGGLPGVTERPLHLERLAPIPATRLFYELAPDQSGLCAQIGASSYSDALKKLSEQPVLEFLSGHPKALELAAPLLEDRSLEQLYQLLVQEKERALRAADVPDEDRDGVFTASLNVSLNYLRQKNQEAVRLFSVLGLLPGGVLPSDLEAIWGEGWRERMTALVRSSLVERNQTEAGEHFTTFPFITAYAERLLTGEYRSSFGEKICRHFADLSESLYQALGGEKAAFARMLFKLHEANLRGCLEPDRPVPQNTELGQASPPGWAAVYLSLLLMFSGRSHDGIDVARRGVEICQGIADPKGEANTRKALGDLKYRVDDLEGAREDYEAALPIFREIKDRLGEANTLQALGDLKLRVDDLQGAREDYEASLPIYREIKDRLGEANTLQVLGQQQVVEGEPVAALKDLKAALAVHLEIHCLLGASGDILCIGRAQAAAGCHDLAIGLFETALSIHWRINDRFDQALDLNDQAKALMALKETEGAFAAYWQARGILRSIKDPDAARLDKVIDNLKNSMEPAEWKKLEAALEADAETIRLKAVAKVKAGLEGDPFLQEIEGLLENL